MWKNRLKELLYILENSNVNEIDVTFFGIRYRVVKEPSIHKELLPSKVNEDKDDSKETTKLEKSVDQELEKSNTIEGVEVLSPMPVSYTHLTLPTILLV